MNSADYYKMAQEYFESAEALHKTMLKHKAQLKSCTNREHLNDVVQKYRDLYYDTLNIGKSLERKAKEIESGVNSDV